MTAAELEARLAALETGAPIDERAFPQKVKRYIYSHLNHGSGICPQCAPWLGVLTVGPEGGTPAESEGIMRYADGVPVVPQHSRCKCYLAPIFVSALDSKEPDDHKDHFEWLQGLPKSRLSKIVGQRRAQLVFDGTFTIPELYDRDTFQLIPLNVLLKETGA
jgi:hypothetical protein